LGDYGILVVACSPKTGEAWIGATNDPVRRVSAAGELGPPFRRMSFRTTAISISPTNGEVWIADSEALIRLSSEGKILERVPFEKRCLQAWLYAF
jgi:hypothetical protein